MAFCRFPSLRCFSINAYIISSSLANICITSPRYLRQEQFTQLVTRPTHIAGGKYCDGKSCI